MKKTILTKLHAGVLVTAGLLAAFVSGCNNKPLEPEEIEAVAVPIEDNVVEGKELLCLADTEEEAQEIADMYGIELVEFGYGVATFHAENPQAVIQMGKEKGYPELSLNSNMELY